jgi:hypothetical protein
LRRSFRSRLGLAVLTGVLATGALSAPALAAEDALITGTLVDPAGRPVADTFVTVENVENGNLAYGYTSDTGDYSAAVEPGTYRVQFSWKSLTQWAYQKTSAGEAATFVAGSGETVRVDDRLLPTGTVGGRITEQDGTTPLYGSEVTLRRDDAPVATAYTDENGVYSFGGVLPGEYRVAFQWSRDLQYLPGSFTVAAGGNTVADGVLPPPTTLAVKGVDSVTGAPVDGFCVQAGDLETPVCGGADGVATVTGLPAGTVRFGVEAPDGSLYVAQRQLSATLTANRTTTVTVPLVLGGTIAVTAADHVTGQKIEDTCFSLRAIGRPEDFGGGCTGVDGTGTTYAPVAPGTYEVLVRAPGAYGHQWIGKSGGTGDQKAAARIVVTAGRTAKAPAALLDPAGSVTGVVTGAGGAPLNRINVNYEIPPSYASGEPGGVFTDAAGRYTIGKLGPYRWPLAFTLGDGYPYQWSGNAANRFEATKVPVVGGAVSTYDIQLTRTSTLRGTITPPSAEVRLLAYNAVTGDLAGVFHDYRPAGVTSYAIPLAGGQKIKLQWNLYGGSTDSSWHGGADLGTATKITIPASGVKKLNLTHD